MAIAATMAQAQPGPAEAALELKLFLEKAVRADYRVLDFQVLKQRDISSLRRHIRYKARIEFPNGLSPPARAALKNEKLEAVEGDLQEISSRKLVVNLDREARFRRVHHKWSAIVGTTHYLLD